MAESAAAALEALLPPGAVWGPSGDEAWEVGGRTPDVVAAPASAEEAAAVLGLASERGWTAVPAGRGPRVESRPSGPGPLVVVSTARLRHVVRYEPADLTLRAGTGITVGELQGRVRREGQWLALDAPGTPARTLGSVLATGAHGPLHAAFGRPRDQVLGLVLVTGDGRILRLGGDVVKNVAGYDLVKLAVGSRGSLGVITEASVRVHPLPERDVTVTFAPGADDGDGTDALRRAARIPFPLAALELLLPAPAAASGPLVVVRVLGSRKATERVLVALRTALGSGGALSERPSEEFGDGEDEARGAGADPFRRAGDREEASPLVLRIGTLPSRAAEGVSAARRFLDALPREIGAPSGRGGGWIAVHGTTGTVRVGVEGPGPAADWEVVAAPLVLLGRTVREGGGSIRAVRAPEPLRHVAAGWRGVGPVERIATGIRQVFDPAGVLPGRSG